MRLAVLGDIHANAPALKAALKQVDEAGYDLLILLGDLLSYGVDVVETLDLVHGRLAENRTVLLRGNHDVLYDKLLGDDREQLPKLPDWIRESVEWTCTRLSPADWRRLKFHDEYSILCILVAHANPFGIGRWEYLNTLEDYSLAAGLLQKRGMNIGVFGHTHRRKYFHYAAGSGTFLPPTRGSCNRTDVHVLNAGAIGQPRDAVDLAPHVLWVLPDVASDYRKFAFEQCSYDATLYRRALQNSGLSERCVQKIWSYFSPAKSAGDAKNQSDI